MGAYRHLPGANCLGIIDLGAEQLVTAGEVTKFALPQPHPSLLFLTFIVH